MYIYLIVGAFVFFIVGFFLMKKMMDPSKFAGDFAQSQEKFNANPQNYIDIYKNDPNRYKIFYDHIGDNIVGITVGKFPESISSKMKEKFVSTITNVNKFDMSLYYLLATDNQLHILGTDGDNFFMDQAFDFNKIQNISFKPGNINLGKPNILSFDYEGNPYKIEIAGNMGGYPKFTVEKDIAKEMLRTNNDRNFNPYKRKYYTDENDMEDGNLSIIIPQHFNKNFLSKLEKELKIDFPQEYKY